MRRSISYLAVGFAGLMSFAAASLFAEPDACAKPTLGPGEPLRLKIPGAPDAFYYKPQVRGLRPVVMYLHGRGGNPQEDCRKWAKVATQVGWVVCPQGPEDRGNGARAWSNGVTAGQKIMDSAVAALRAKYKQRVQTKNNILVGFSEGAFLAMQVGLHDPGHWNRWLILAANDRYWFGDTQSLLRESRRKLKRVYLLTGQSDEVAANTLRVGATLKSAKIPVKVRIQPGMGHEIPGDKMANHRNALLWLSRG